MNPHRIPVLLATLVVLTLATVRADALDIGSCGASIPDGEVGTLTTDLVCTDPAPAITIGEGARLELGGHRVEGLSVDGPTSLTVLRCVSKRCTIVGPGEVVGNDGVGPTGSCVAGPSGGKLKVTVDGPGTVDIHDCSTGVLASSAKLEGVTAHGCVTGLYGVRLKLVGTHTFGNQVGIFGISIAGRDLVSEMNSFHGIIGAGGGPGGGNVRIKNGEMTGNGGTGVIGNRLSLRDSTVTGNDGYGQGIDIAAFLEPKLHDVTCVKSGRTSEAYTQGPPALIGTWSVCSGD